jgi:hypothetical protein
MSNFPRKPAPASKIADPRELIAPLRVEFLGEQTGPAEEKLKEHLRRIFTAQTPNVFRRAYLARISYGEPSVSSVVICIRHAGHIEEALQRGFKHMFGEISRGGDFYDFMTIGEKQEQELKKVCRPFYEAA